MQTEETTNEEMKVLNNVANDDFLNKEIISLKLSIKILKNIVVISLIIAIISMVISLIAILGLDKINAFIKILSVKYYELIPLIKKASYELFIKISKIISQQTFNNREIATAIWTGIALIIILFSKQLRKNVADILKVLFTKLFLVLFSITCIYTIIIVLFLIRFNFWDVEMLKDTMVWIVFSAFIACINSNNDKKKEKYFKYMLFDNLKLILVVEFLINTYPFNLITEIIIFPIMVFIIVFLAFFSNKPEYMKVKSLFVFLQAVLGIALLYNAIYTFITNIKSDNVLDTLKDFALTPILNIMFIPFIFIFSFVLKYDLIKMRLKMGREKPKDIINFCLRKIFFTLHINLKKLNEFLSNNAGALIKIQNKDEINRILASYKKKKINQESELDSILSNMPYKDLLLKEVEKEYISKADIELYLYMQSRFEYYEKEDGKYIISKHDPLVIQEAQEKFKFSKEEVDRKHYIVGNLMVGIEPKEEIELHDKAITVKITIDKVGISAQKELVVTVTNLTNIDKALPTINMSFELYNDDKKVSFQTVWAEDFKVGTMVFRSLPVSEVFDSVECTAYIDIENMKIYNLKSSVQVSNNKGETVIPVYILPRKKIN